MRYAAAPRARAPAPRPRVLPAASPRPRSPAPRPPPPGGCAAAWPRAPSAYRPGPVRSPRPARADRPRPRRRPFGPPVTRRTPHPGFRRREQPGFNRRGRPHSPSEHRRPVGHDPSRETAIAGGTFGVYAGARVCALCVRSSSACSLVVVVVRRVEQTERVDARVRTEPAEQRHRAPPRRHERDHHPATRIGRGRAPGTRGPARPSPRRDPDLAPPTARPCPAARAGVARPATAHEATTHHTPTPDPATRADRQRSRRTGNSARVDPPLTAWSRRRPAVGRRGPRAPAARPTPCSAGRPGRGDVPDERDVPDGRDVPDEPGSRRSTALPRRRPQPRPSGPPSADARSPGAADRHPWRRPAASAHSTHAAVRFIGPTSSAAAIARAGVSA